MSFNPYFINEFNPLPLEIDVGWQADGSIRVAVRRKVYTILFMGLSTDYGTYL